MLERKERKSGLEQPRLARTQDCLAAAGDLQFAKDAIGMGFDRTDGKTNTCAASALDLPLAISRSTFRSRRLRRSLPRS
jgi:hypothetical protein